MYVRGNPKTKTKAKEQVLGKKASEVLFYPGIDPGMPTNGTETAQGPHYPEPHKWYAKVTIENGIVTKFT